MNLEIERERVVQELCTHYAQDHLSTGELELRVERVYRSADQAQLLTVLEGLPAIAPMHAPLVPLHAAPVQRIGGRGIPEDEKRYVAVFSEVKKEGAWTPPRRINAKSAFGGIVLDFRGVEVPPDGVDIEIDVIFGEASIILPPGLNADVDCTALLATVEDKTQPGAPGAPTIRVRGGAVFGGISVKTKVPKRERMESWRKQLKSWLGTEE